MKVFFKVACFVLLLASCGKVEKIKPDVNFVDGNTLLPQVSFHTSDSALYSVFYWPNEKPQHKQESSLSRGKEHAINLYNLKAETRYGFYVANKTSGARSETFYFDTQFLPKSITAVEKHTIDTAQFDGFVLVRGLAPKGADVIIDNKGDVVWYHLYDTAVRRPFSWTNRQSVLSIYDSAHIVEYGIDGTKLVDMRLEEKGIDNMVHHDIIYNKKGSIVTLTHDSVRMDLRKFGGKNNQFLRADGILVVSPSGQVEWTWNLLQVIDPLKLNPKDVDITHSLGHANSIALDKDGNYLVSFRDFSQIWKINADDGSVIWKLGAGGDFVMDQTDYFLRQHSAYTNASGDLVLFDNGDRKTRPYSRVLVFDLDENGMIAKTKVNIRLNDELSADKMCSAEEIEEGKYLVCTSKKKGIISVIDSQGNVLWRVNLSRPSYRAYYLKNPFRPATDL